MSEKKKQLINAHTHVFTGRFVPPYLAKTFLWPPFYKLLHIPTIVRLLKRWFAEKNEKEYDEKKYGERKKKDRKYQLTMLRKRNIFVGTLYWTMVVITSVVAGVFIYSLLNNIKADGNWIDRTLVKVVNLVPKGSGWYWAYFILQLSITILAFWLIRPTRSLIIYLAGRASSFVRTLFSENTRSLIDRYLMLIRFALYKRQADIARRELNQLPKGSGIVILPMDMKYMDAGEIKVCVMNEKKKGDDKCLRTKNGRKVWEKDPYRVQMDELAKMKTTDDKKVKEGDPRRYYPFVFIDPRRIRGNGEDTEGKSFFDYTFSAETGQVTLEDCFIKEFIEEKNFNGLKIYPALGYYPFDEALLPLWKYAADNQIPIMTHCVRGVVYYRGKKKKEWDYHPLFRQLDCVEDEKHTGPLLEQGSPMLLDQTKNEHFQINFTHPLNYLCLVEEKLLRLLVSRANQDVQDIFGFTDCDTPLERDLSHLKVCLAHYGGEREWIRYMEQDRQQYSQKLMTKPLTGIDFMKADKNCVSWEKLYQLWHDADWYSIINSLILQYDNVYTDISFTISKESIQPLLKTTVAREDCYEEQRKVSEQIACLQRKGEPVDEELRKKALVGQNKLRSRVLFGTDFYVVRNHKSDKNLFTITKALLDDEEFDVIARDNPAQYLNLLE